ncbi:MAG: NAD(P)H-hydrate dehydratase [Oscillospiraceae bacterium]|jgi:NAD(P)H-hydrate epimerase|nr:NAD(P)H-hydrate dehydratase [Oscillospiraceae bacterium]
MYVFTYSRTAQNFCKHFPPRRRDAHKYNFGRVLSICGSERFPGAAVLAARAAVFSGAGVVRAAFPRAAYAAIAPQLTEPILFPLPGNTQGQLAKGALEELLSACEKSDAVLLGCGLGQSLDTAAIVPELTEKCPAPLILDADALNLLVGKLNLLRARSAPTILTPHAGEFARLQAGVSTLSDPRSMSAERDSVRLHAAHRFAAEYGVTLVLKGAGTLVAHCGSPAVYRNKTGNPAMATAGSGDMLAGIMLGFWGQGLPARTAAECAVFVHGLCGDLAVADSVIAARSLTPSYMLDRLPHVLAEQEQLFRHLAEL